MTRVIVLINHAGHFKEMIKTYESVHEGYRVVAGDSSTRLKRHVFVFEVITMTTNSLHNTNMLFFIV